MTYRLQNMMLAMLLALTTLFVGFGTVGQNPMSGGYQLFERAVSEISADNTLAALENFTPPPETASECCNAPNRTDWPELSGSLREAGDSARAALDGKGPINFGMGTFSRSQTIAMGEAWVGPGYRVTSRGYYESADGLRQFRPPSAKPNSQFATTGEQANFEQRLTPSGAWGANGHVNVTP